ncbi:carbon-nitrogen hydrolase family protein [Leucobacter aridicollis]|uniref:carbon-nitrogen hydrolase family protein n=1 Tax=Leucobacter aridicollis TaxID=283878 RepID=UPI0021081D6E|nr:carbon-nitrogen hydrolase family protein [Leucobacter aridicollis]UTX53822.1 carbon-nitrogen hydrolase family protein [Leucobacter aridicollis]
MTHHTVAIVQYPPVVLDLKASIARAVDHVLEAADAGARLVVFPETWLTCYPAWAFGMAGWDDAEARHWHARLLAESPVIGRRADSEDELADLRAVAANRQVTIVIGLNERSGSGGTLYNSILTIGPDGSTLNLHRKLVPTHSERIIWGAGDAAGLRAVDTPVGMVGGLVCWEHWMPLARQALHATGEEIHIAAWPETSDIHQVAARSYAFEGRCFVLSAGLFLAVEDLPETLREPFRIGVGPEAPTSGLLFDGGSSIIGPDGNYVVEPVRGRQGIVLGDIDLSAIDRAHHDLDVVGHSARNDVFELKVDARRREGVVVQRD